MPLLEALMPLHHATRSRRPVRRLLEATVVALVVLTSLAAATPARAAAATSITPAEAERQFVEKLNAVRGSRGALVVTSAIVTGSRSWSAGMQQQQRLFHDSNLAGAMDNAVPGWSRIGENVGYGYSVQQIHDAFYASAGHRENMLGDYNQVGIGVTIESSGKIWVTVRFAKGPIPRPRHVPDRIGVRSADAFQLRSSLSAGAPTTSFTYGQASDIAVMGDWDGNGTDTPGVFRNGTWFLRNSNSSGAANLTFAFGQAGDVPLVGDWDGNGTDTIGVRRGATWYLRNANSNGPYTKFTYGNTTDVPVVGDWDGNGTHTIGVRRGATWYLRNANSNGPYTKFTYGNTTDVPVVGDWDGNGSDTVGVRRGTTWYLRNANSNGPYTSFVYGSTSARPLVGGF